MTELRNTNFIDALLRRPITRTPVWMMRQAGRYLPEYRALRKEVTDFVEFCQTPSLCAEAACQPLARFDLDAAILFSDILTVPNAMGMPLRFDAGAGPVFSEPCRDARSVAALSEVGPAELGYVMEAVSTTKQALGGRVPLIGFAGSPWTIACYMVEGQSSKLWPTTKTMMYQQPAVLHALLDKLATSITAYLNGQIESGADAIMLFDTWGGVLSHEAYRAFSLHYMQKIVAGLHRQYDGKTIPCVLFTKHGGAWLDVIAATGCDGLGIDCMTNLAEARQRVGDRVALQGNLEPFHLFSNPEAITASVNSILSVYNGDTGFVFNLGHGIDRHTPISGVEAMLAAIRAYPSSSLI